MRGRRNRQDAEGKRKASGRQASYLHSMGRASRARNMRPPPQGRQSLSDSERTEGKRQPSGLLREAQSDPKA